MNKVMMTKGCRREVDSWPCVAVCVGGHYKRKGGTEADGRGAAESPK